MGPNLCSQGPWGGTHSWGSTPCRSCSGGHRDLCWSQGGPSAKRPLGPALRPALGPLQFHPSWKALQPVGGSGGGVWQSPQEEALCPTSDQVLHPQDSMPHPKTLGPTPLDSAPYRPATGPWAPRPEGVPAPAPAVSPHHHHPQWPSASDGKGRASSHPGTLDVTASVEPQARPLHSCSHSPKCVTALVQMPASY